MATTPFLDERRLKKALTEQGFTLTNVSKGVRVLAPDGVGTSVIHPSVFSSQQHRRAYRNQLAQLTRIGFDLDKVDVPANGKADEWKAEREEIEKVIAELDAASEAEAEVLPDVTEDIETRKKIRDLSPMDRELYDLIAERPGLKPAQYAGHLNWERHASAAHGKRLQAEGLIEATGATQSRRYWVTGQVDLSKIAPSEARASKPVEGRMATNGRPSASRVRTRSVEPADRVVRFKRMGEKAMRLKVEMEDIVSAMVAQYEDQEQELKQKDVKLAKLESILGRAVDVV